MKKRIAALLLALLTVLPLLGCGIRAQELTRDIQPQGLDTSTDLSAGGTAVTSFALSLLQSSDAGRTARLLSPLSVLYALGMTANGASGETLKQIETAAGMSLTELNDYLYTFRLPTAKAPDCPWPTPSGCGTCSARRTIFSAPASTTTERRSTAPPLTPPSPPT